MQKEEIPTKYGAKNTEEIAGIYDGPERSESFDHVQRVHEIRISFYLAVMV